MYPSAQCYVRQEVASALANVQAALCQKGLGLKIWDAYRPHHIQYVLWDTVPDNRYVADPKKGSCHNYGAAVDVTLINLATRKELEMPTEFDDFTQKAWRSYQDLPEHVKANRQLLEDVMNKYGFIGLPTEWWHFDYKDWQSYEILDISFDKLD